MKEGFLFFCHLIIQVGYFYRNKKKKSTISCEPVPCLTTQNIKERLQADSVRILSLDFEQHHTTIGVKKAQPSTTQVGVSQITYANGVAQEPRSLCINIKETLDLLEKPHMSLILNVSEQKFYSFKDVFFSFYSFLIIVQKKRHKGAQDSRAWKPAVVPPFDFGETQVWTLEQTQQFLLKAMVDVDVLVVHAARTEVDVLTKWGIAVPPCLVDIQNWSETGKDSLVKLTGKLEVPHNFNFHNAGNDAVFTLLCFQKLFSC